MRRCFLFLIVFLTITLVTGDNYTVDVIIFTFLGYLCGIIDSGSTTKIKEPYIIGDSNEIVYLTKEELKKRMEG
ncbi:hypothetical protein BD01_1871 [Thermococcus nautili]|uniref:Uncharacterized protein n=1 Tax=Thermococcus nautili TaxID=195522 RepID=W8NW07_9EURY|nr:hypothetical protein BD01_1871 [Thermococcus nautili]